LSIHSVTPDGNVSGPLMKPLPAPAWFTTSRTANLLARYFGCASVSPDAPARFTFGTAAAFCDAVAAASAAAIAAPTSASTAAPQASSAAWMRAWSGFAVAADTALPTPDGDGSASGGSEPSGRLTSVLLASSVLQTCASVGNAGSAGRFGSTVVVPTWNTLFADGAAARAALAPGSSPPHAASVAADASRTASRPSARGRACGRNLRDVITLSPEGHRLHPMRLGVSGAARCCGAGAAGRAAVARPVPGPMHARDMRRGATVVSHPITFRRPAKECAAAARKRQNSGAVSVVDGFRKTFRKTAREWRSPFHFLGKRPWWGAFLGVCTK